MRKISEQEFNELKGTKSLVVCVSAGWCTNCRELHPRLERVEPEYPQGEFVEIDADSVSDEFIAKYGIEQLPHLFVSTKERDYPSMRHDYMTDDNNVRNYVGGCVT